MVDKKRFPVDDYREVFVDSVRKNPVTILTGPTGSGKTTRLPVFLWQAGLTRNGIIGVTQPRRLAATSVAKFIAGQQGIELGREIGYQIRFDNSTRFDTEIKLMTDGIILQEFLHDRLLGKYSVIMVDEAHERNQNIDLLLGLLKDLLKQRDDLKVVVSSATMDAMKFSEYFGNAPVIEVPGRMHDVEVVWGDHDHSQWDVEDVISDAVEIVSQIHQAGNPGDILVFLPGEAEINSAIEMLKEKHLAGLVALPAHGSLSPQDQQRIFQSFNGCRKVIIATNIAETSLTIDGVVYVVDSGLIKETRFHPESGIESLDVVGHSQSGCEQRKGRAGRTQPGVCYRLFTQEGFLDRDIFTEPEIRRSNLASVVLAMESLGIEDVEGFGFIDPPDREAFHEAYQTLISLGAIRQGHGLTKIGERMVNEPLEPLAVRMLLEAKEHGSIQNPVGEIYRALISTAAIRQSHGLTKIGEQMAKLPLEPRIARMLLEAKEYGCVQEIAAIAALLSVKNIFCRPRDKQPEADRAHLDFRNEDSDALTLLSAWRQWEAQEYDRQWCHDHFLDHRALKEAKDISIQLFRILRQQRIDLSSNLDSNVIRRCLAAGLVGNLLVKTGQYSYNKVFNCLEGVFIHPGSVLCSFFCPNWIVAVEIRQTTKQFACGCTLVETEWLPEIAPDRFRLTPWRLKSYEAGEEYAMAWRLLQERNAYSGEWETMSRQSQGKKVTLEQAVMIQQESLTEARANDWQAGRIMREGIFPALITPNGVLEVASSSLYRPSDGNSFCFFYVQHRKGIFEFKDEAHTLFPVFDLPGSPLDEALEINAPLPKPALKPRPATDRNRPSEAPQPKPAPKADPVPVVISADTIGYLQKAFNNRMREGE